MKSANKYNLSKIMRLAWSTYRSKTRRNGRTFGECLKEAWSKEKRYVAIWAKDEALEASKRNGYNDVNIPLSAYYSGNTGLYGANFCND